MRTVYAWLTPDVLPLARVCKRLYVPDDEVMRAAVAGALIELTYEHRWEKYGDVEPVAAAAAMLDMWREYMTSPNCMIGTLVQYITEDPPDGVLELDGSTHNNDDYPDLASRISSVWDNGDGTFTLPDLRGRVTVGAGLSYSEGDIGGIETVTLDISEIPSHTHAAQPHAHTEGVAAPGLGGAVPGTGAIPAVGATSAATVAIDSTGGGGAHENMPPYTAVKIGVWAR